MMLSFIKSSTATELEGKEGLKPWNGWVQEAEQSTVYFEEGVEEQFSEQVMCYWY